MIVSACKGPGKPSVAFFARLLLVLAVVSSFQHSPPPDTAAAAAHLREVAGLMKNKQYEAALPGIRSALDVYERAGNDTAWVAACKKLDLCFYYLNRPDEGIAFFEKALKKKDRSMALRANLLLLLADNHYLKGDYPRAIETYEQGLPPAEQVNSAELLMRYYGNLGWLYWEAGNHAKALEFQKKSLQLAEKEKDTANIPTLLYYIGDTYRTMGDPQALDYFRRALALAPEHVQARIQFSKAFQAFGMIDSALAVLKPVEPLLNEDTEKADARYQFARLYLALNDRAGALANILEAQRYGLKGYGEHHNEYARISVMTGRIYLASGDFRRALHWFEGTLSRQSGGALQRPFKAEKLRPGSYWVLGSLEGIGQAGLRKYRQSKDTGDLHAALEAFETGLVYGEKMRLSHSQESSKLELYEYLKPVVEGGVKTALELAAATGDYAFLEKAFLFAERAKAPVMAEALYDKSVKHIAGIPDSVLAQEKTLQETVVGLENDVYDAPENDSLQNALLNARLALERMKDGLKTRFPRYYEMKYAFSKQTGMHQIHERLDADDLLIHYLTGDSTLYAFAVSTTNIQAFSIPLNDSLLAALATFRRAVSDWDFVQKEAAEAERDFLATAPALFNDLLARPLAGSAARKLIIEPDGYLNLIPFEALLTTPYSGSWKDLDVPYLIRDYTIAYAWSAGAPATTEIPGEEPRYRFAGFGTEYANAIAGEGLALRDLGPLPNADDEVEAVGKIMKGKTWLNADATRENFLAAAPDCGVLHIAAHGILDAQNPMRSHLVFEGTEKGDDARLYIPELYNIQMKARMTVLSACNTGQGRIHEGEGAMSLARAFAFAGCPTLVGSLWSINDQSSADLMQRFYRALESGKRVDESLRDAKLAYLETTTSEYAKPIYWAGFVAIGARNPLPASLFGRSIDGFWIAAAVVLALVAAGLLYRLRKKRLAGY